MSEDCGFTLCESPGCSNIGVYLGLCRTHYQSTIGVERWAAVNKVRGADAAGGIDATLAERGSRYGVFADQAAIAQALKDAMRAAPGWAKLAPDMKEALDMEANKNARILNGDPDYHDSWHDKVGYAKLVADRLVIKL